MYNSNDRVKLTYELWLEDWKKKHCQTTPTNCYLCHRQTGFSCAACSHFVYYSDSQICGGNYNTGSCFCANCQELIKNWLEKRNCSCEFSLAGYSTGIVIVRQLTD